MIQSTAPALRRSTGVQRAIYRLFQSAWAGNDLLYPPYCAGCSAPGSRWCGSCQVRAPIISQPICDRCGRSQARTGRCLSCLKRPPTYMALRSYAYYEGSIRSAIHRLKYKNDLALGDSLSKPLISMLEEENWPVELVVPVPSGAAHQARRGYNQAVLLAWPPAQFFGLVYRSQALAKTRQIRSQVGLTIEERFQNVAGAFKAQSRLVEGRSILLVDDVMTSGATVQECTRSLVDAGALRVYCLTLARAPFAA